MWSSYSRMWAVAALLLCLAGAAIGEGDGRTKVEVNSPLVTKAAEVAHTIKRASAADLRPHCSLCAPGNGRVLAAHVFALSELRKLCDYCSDDLRDAYQAMSIKAVDHAETKETTLNPGTMVFLKVQLATDKPAEGGRAADAQTVIVFQNEDGSYNGISMERSPFLDK